MGDDDTARIAALFDTFSPRVYAYARRHVDAADAQDVVADTFLVAWRRYGDVPADALPWLLVVARNVIANQQRWRRRQRGLHDQIEVLDRLAGPASGPDHDVVERLALLEAVAQLSRAEREACCSSRGTASAAATPRASPGARTGPSRSGCPARGPDSGVLPPTFRMPEEH